MGKGIVLNKKGLLLWRLGTLDFKDQSYWGDRSPEKKGMWAFPYPYYDTFFTYHQYSLIAPKKFRGDLSKSFIANSDFRYVDAKLRDVPVVSREVVENGWGFKGPLGTVEVVKSNYEKYEEWVKQTGRKVLPLRKFYWIGDVYCRLTDDSSRWRLLSVEDFARAVMKTAGTSARTHYSDGYEHARNAPPASNIPGYKFSQAYYSVDHLEVFLSPKRGKINGSIKERGHE